jgi:hypothetical protein
MTQPEHVELGAPKMEDQFLASGPLSYFIKQNFLNKVWFILAKKTCWIMWIYERLYAKLC